MQKIIYLESVGTYYNPANKLTSATKDFTECECVNLQDCSDEWINSLSRKDLSLVGISA